MAAARKFGLLYFSLMLYVCDFIGMVNAKPHVLTLFPLDTNSKTMEGGGLFAAANTKVNIRVLLAEYDFENIHAGGLFFTPDESSCVTGRKSRVFPFPNITGSNTTNRNHIDMKVYFHPLLEGEDFMYICLALSSTDFEHQGTDQWLRIGIDTTEKGDRYLLPFWLQIMVIGILLVLSGLFSGLNLGLMSLEKTELKIIEKVGSEKEKKYVKRIGPLRAKGNLLLCTLLLGNVMVNSTATILMDNLSNGLVAVMLSTGGIVIFGEIIPQAICSRHGLAVGARTYYITVFFMIITYPIAMIVAWILDKVLGEEMGQVYNKEKLQELIRMTADRRVLHDNEANIISGALQLTNKSVEDVMTKIEDVYMLEINTVLDFETLTEIMHQGYTRIPVYDGEKTNIVNLLNTKDLALIDPDDRTLLSTVCKFYDHKPLFVDFDVKLDAMLQEFLHGMVNAKPRVLTLFPLDTNSKIIEGGGIFATANTKVNIRILFAEYDFENIHAGGLFFTPDESSCVTGRKSRVFPFPNITGSSTTNRSHIDMEVYFHPLLEGEDFMYICLALSSTDLEHQGTDQWLRVSIDTTEKGDGYLLPLWLQIMVIIILLILSGLFSGLNLGLMSLEKTELKIIEKVGTEKEKKYAKRIGPLRAKGNLLLCTLLLGNVMVNSTATILMDNLSNGLVAVMLSTGGIVIFGEIIPQAICSRHGLAVGAKTYYITVFFMIVTYPIAVIIAWILDKVLGEEMGQVYNKEKLQELIRMTADRRVLHDNEANIISGALQLTNKSVQDVMTKIEDVYMLDINTVLDFETLTQIMHQGYTRIPVYDGEKTNIVNLLNTKDLALIDPDDRTLLSTVCKFYDHKPLFVDFDVKLDAMLQEFLHGNSHMALVQHLHNTEDHDPYFENVGVITLEDVIEEILQSEIVDETDLKTDNRQKEIRNRKKQDYGMFVPEEQRSKLPKQLAFVAFQFLTTTVEPFSDTYLARNVLKNLMKKDIVVNLTPTEGSSRKNYIYQKGVTTDKFVLILQGTVEVEIGGESMVFETGPFSYFGQECLKSLRAASTSDNYKPRDYIPDFSVRAVTDVQYLCIKRAHYIAALRTTRMLRQSGSIAINDAFDAEFERVSKNNHNSMLENHSPPPNTTLESLKFDDTGKKRSTSSLDRLTFFHRRHDPMEGLYRMRRTGSDAKDTSLEYQNEVEALIEKPATEVRESRSSGDNIAVSPSSPSDSKKRSLTSLPFSPHGAHKLDFLKELEDNGTEHKDGGGDKTKNSSQVAGQLSADAEPKLGHQEEEGSSVDVCSPPNNGDVCEMVPLVSIKKPGDKEQENVDGAAGESFQANCNDSGDGERAPLMNRDDTSDTTVS